MPSNGGPYHTSSLKKTSVAWNEIGKEAFLEDQYNNLGGKKKTVTYTPSEILEKYGEAVAEPEVLEGPNPYPKDWDVAAPAVQTRTEHLVYYLRDKPIGDYSDSPSSPALPYINIRDLMARFFLTAHYHDFGMGGCNWRNRCIGISSLIRGATPPDNNNHMPMLDYDGSNVKKKLRKDVKLLQEGFGLGDAWVYQTRRGYHVYFLTDGVSWDIYKSMLAQVQCCKGFRKAALNRGYAVLRVSAKYTQFDIKLEYILRSKIRTRNRVSQKGHIIQKLIEMGQECGTHLAVMFPQQTFFEEDGKNWRPPSKRGKRIRKVKNIPDPNSITVGKPVVIKFDNDVMSINDKPIHPANAAANYTVTYTNTTVSSTTTMGGQWTTSNNGIWTGNDQ